MLRGVDYDRISEVEAKQETVPGIDLQRAHNQAYAAEHGIQLVASLDDNRTASRFSLKDRAGFVTLMNLVRDNAVDVILVTEQSRLDRQLWNILELIELARTTTLKQIHLTRSGRVLDLSNEDSINSLIDQANRDRHESEIISERVKFRNLGRAKA